MYTYVGKFTNRPITICHDQYKLTVYFSHSESSNAWHKYLTSHFAHGIRLSIKKISPENTHIFKNFAFTPKSRAISRKLVAQYLNVPDFFLRRFLKNKLYTNKPNNLWTPQGPYSREDAKCSYYFPLLAYFIYFKHF